MYIIGLDGKKYRLKLESGREVCYAGIKSGYHLQARELIRTIFPSDPIFEEVFIPGCSTSLFLDFFLSIRRMAIEVQGQQHYGQVEHFQKNKFEYLAALKRDKEKAEWCSINNIKLIELKYNEPDRWRTQILGTEVSGD